MSTESTKAYASALKAVLPDMLAMTERLVNIDSGTRCSAGVNAVAAELGRSLEELGFSVARCALPGLGDQVECALTPGEGPRLLVLGHTDTVWPIGTTDEWRFEMAGDRISGPGVGDMKSCLVMALFALRELRRTGALSRLGSLRFLLVPDEEHGSIASRTWLEDAARDADVCLTLEAGAPGGGVVVARGAVGVIQVGATGASAHCTSAEPGTSAVSALAPLVANLEALSDLLAGTRVSVGIFRGGTARQVVPDAAELHVDLRARDAASASALVERIRAIVDECERPGVQIHMSGGITRPAFPQTPESKALFGLVRERAAALGTPIEIVVESGGSDASFAAGLGVPTLDGLGPICHESCSRAEWVEIPSLVTRGAIFASLVAALPRELALGLTRASRPCHSDGSMTPARRRA